MGAPAVDLLTEAEAARLLRIGERTLRGLRRDGLIRYVAVTARKIMYRPEDCAEYVEARVTMAEAAQPTRRKRTRRSTGCQIIPFSQIARP